MEMTDRKETRSGPAGGRHHIAGVGLAAAALYLCLLAFPSASAWASDEHAFDPVLSLRGDCSTSALDEVRDPGPCPGVAGVDHPVKPLQKPCGTAVDPHGDIYVANPEVGLGEGTEGHIDVFDPQGKYLTEIEDEFQPCDLAVDSEGNLYVREASGHDIVLYRSTSYPPAKDSSYGPRIVIHEPHSSCVPSAGLDHGEAVAVDPSNDHLFVSRECRITEYDSASNGSALIAGREEIGFGLGRNLAGIDVCAASGDVYAAGVPFGFTTQEAGDPTSARVFIFDGTDGHLKAEIDGSEVPGDFGFIFGSAQIAIDQSNCDFYVGDISEKGVVDQFDAEGHYIGQLEHSMVDEGQVVYAGLAVDDPFPGQSNYDSPNEGEVYVAQGVNAKTSHLYAFKPGAAGPPEVQHQGVSGVTETEAVLEAELDPSGLDTHYHFEYISQADFEADGEEFGAGTSSAPTPDADAGAGTFLVPVATAVAGLSPGAAYRFRLVASNCEAEGAIAGECLTEGEGKPGGEGEDAAFATYVPDAGLPDGRAYELVTPPDTNGLIPTMAALGENADGNFDTLLASPDGESVVFGSEGGSLPALGGGGFHDTYEAVRSEGGWQSHFSGIDGTEAETPNAGSPSPDHRYSFWRIEQEGRGSLPQGSYLRLPDGGVQPIGLGSFGQDLTASGRLITPGASHVIFATGTTFDPETVQLEENAPPTGTPAVYDRSPGGATHVVSLLPGDITPGAGFSSFFQGASPDGAVIAFKTLSSPGALELDAPLYARVDNTETLEVASGKTVFGGISRHGERIVYLRPNSTEPDRPNPILPIAHDFPQGDIFVYDTATKATTAIGSGEKSLLVNVSPDGSHVYFDSTKRLNGEGKVGAENLYVWDAASASTRLVAVLATADVFGQPTPGVNSAMSDGLGLWVRSAVSPTKFKEIGPGSDPSRTSADGSILLFESRAKLTAYDNNGRAEVYRYDASAAPGEAIACLSCNPTGVLPQSDARLQTLPASLLETLPPVNLLAAMPNLSPDGGRAFFESGDPLVVGDVDGKVDVYEWEAQGVGDCERAGGCVHLISSGHSARDDYLYAAGADGSDVFVETGDLLVPEDHDSTYSIYDARIGGGFPQAPPPPGECLGEACQPAAKAPNDATPASSSFSGPGNPAAKRSRRCPKGTRKLRRAGRARCVKDRPGSHRKRKRTHVHRRASR